MVVAQPSSEMSFSFKQNMMIGNTQNVSQFSNSDLTHMFSCKLKGVYEK
jgi:hypothetical protein